MGDLNCWQNMFAKHVVRVREPKARPSWRDRGQAPPPTSQKIIKLGSVPKVAVAA